MSEQELKEATAEYTEALVRFRGLSSQLAKLRDSLPEPEMRSPNEIREWNRMRGDVSWAQKERIRTKRRWLRLKKALDPYFVPDEEQKVVPKLPTIKPGARIEGTWFKTIAEAVTNPIQTSKPRTELDSIMEEIEAVASGKSLPPKLETDPLVEFDEEDQDEGMV